MIRKTTSFLFSAIKQLSVTANSTPKGMKVISNTNQTQIEIESPLQILVATLPACQLSTARVLMKNGKFQIHNAKFTKVESSYDTSHFMVGGPTNKIGKITLVGQFQTNGTQKDLDAFHKKVQDSCPVFQTFKAAGIQIQQVWKNIQKN